MLGQITEGLADACYVRSNRNFVIFGSDLLCLAIFRLVYVRLGYFRLGYFILGYFRLG